MWCTSIAVLQGMREAARAIAIMRGLPEINDDAAEAAVAAAAGAFSRKKRARSESEPGDGEGGQQVSRCTFLPPVSKGAQCIALPVCVWCCWRHGRGI
jgi:hypothetical protein